MARNKAFDPQEKLEKAQELFLEKGYSATSMQDLVDGMQLNRASIYDTYGDKYALFQQCLENYAKDKLLDYRQCCKKGSPLAAVEHIMRKTLENRREEQAKQSITILQELLEKAQQLKEIPADKEPATLAQFLYASFSSLWMMDVLFNDKRMLDKLVEHILNSIRQ
jgi:TetR/AcrR family transcriptional regulator, transcriptional repressor for nem operon